MVVDKTFKQWHVGKLKLRKNEHTGEEEYVIHNFNSAKGPNYDKLGLSDYFTKIPPRCIPFTPGEIVYRFETKEQADSWTSDTTSLEMSIRPAKIIKVVETETDTICYFDDNTSCSKSLLRSRKKRLVVGDYYAFYYENFYKVTDPKSPYCYDEEHNRKLYLGIRIKDKENPDNDKIVLKIDRDHEETFSKFQIGTGDGKYSSTYAIPTKKLTWEANVMLEQIKDKATLNTCIRRLLEDLNDQSEIKRDLY